MSQAETVEDAAPLGAHGALRLPSVTVDSYNLELKGAGGGFLGDRASKKGLRAHLEEMRKGLRKLDKDPFGDTPTEEISKKALDAALDSKDLDAVGVVMGVIEEFAKELALVTRRFLKTAEWHGTQCIAVGGGLRESEVGLRAIARAGVILASEGEKAELVPIHHHPDDAGLLGVIHLAPAWIFKGHDAIFAVDIGGTNIRVGTVATRLEKAQDGAKAEVLERQIWRHADDAPKRDEAIDELVSMLKRLIRHAKKEGLVPAPFIGIGCPGKIEADGTIDRGAQNLPGNWETPKFNLPHRIREAIPEIDGSETLVLMHNDAVVQGLSERPRMSEVKRWGALTIGTGLGNARFTNRGKGE